MNRKRILEILDGKSIVRGKITFSLITNYLLGAVNLAPKEIQTEQSIESLWFRISKIDRIIANLLVSKEFKKNTFKRAIESLHLDKNNDKENLEIIDTFMKEIDDFNKDYKNDLENELKEFKERLNLFLSADISKTEKGKFLRDVLREYHDFILLQLEKEREVQLPIGKFEVRVHGRFGTKNIHFEPTKPLKDMLIANSDVNTKEIDKQKELMQKHIQKKGKHLKRLEKFNS